MQESFYEYALTTIKGRALPDVRDGLKPVHRRILYGMSALHMTHNKPHKKSARIVGDILGKYHPHGDSSVYEAMVRLSQDFTLMIPLVDGHGNFGSIDGDGAAAMRYTEARLSLAGERLSQDLEKGVVTFQSNYDESEVEPTVLPARFPNLIVNGSEGIATGMATNIPSHNPQEVADAWAYMIEHEERANEALLLTKLSAPDYPMGGVIVNEADVRDFYTTGYGTVTMRGVHHIEEPGGAVTRLVFTELPRKAIGSKNDLVNKLIDLVNKRVLPEVVDVVDESSREGIRLVIDVKKDTDMDRFLNKLWLRTDLQSSDRMQFLVLIGGKPETISLMRYFQEYIAFQKDLHIKRHAYLLKEVVDRLEIVDGLLTAHSVMDVLIDAIRHAHSAKTLVHCLTAGEVSGIDWHLKKHQTVAKKFAFTKRQAEAILNRQLRTLTGLDIKQLTKEQAKLNREKKHHEAVMTDKLALKRELLKDVDAFRSDYPASRRTTVTTRTTDVAILEERVVEPIGVLVDVNGFAQTRESIAGTALDAWLRADTDVTDTVAVFTSTGNLYHIRVTDIPTDKKIPLQVLSELQPGEKIVYLALGSQLATKTFFVLTQLGKGKLLKGTELVTKGYRSKTFYTKLDTKRADAVCFLTDAPPKKWVVVQTDAKRGGRIDMTDARVPLGEKGKSAMGSGLVKMKKGEQLTAIHPVTGLEADLSGTHVSTYPDVTGITVKPLPSSS